MINRFTLFLSFALLSLGVQGQQLKGTVSDRNSRYPLEQVQVLNRNTGHSTVTDAKGRFKINAVANQVIVFFQPGYLPDTLFLVNMSPVKRYLTADRKTLNTVEIKAKTFNPEIEYADVYRKADPTRLEVNKPFGFSPSAYFGKEGKEARRLKRKLEKEKTERKIDARFNNAAVTALTPLKGADLDAFMTRYRPTLEALNKMDQEDLKFYIMNSYKEFKNLPPEKRTMPDLH